MECAEAEKKTTDAAAADAVGKNPKAPAPDLEKTMDAAGEKKTKGAAVKKTKDKKDKKGTAKNTKAAFRPPRPVVSEDSFTSLSIRFSCEDNGKTTYTTYQKEQPSRLARSRQIHDNYRRMVEEDQKIDICAMNLDGDGSDNLDSRDTVKPKPEEKTTGTSQNLGVLVQGNSSSLSPVSHLTNTIQPYPARQEPAS